jgi:BMFP domain-containing protein YqiC
MSIALMMRLEAMEKRVAELEQKLAARQAAAEAAEPAPAPRPEARPVPRTKKAAA